MSNSLSLNSSYDEKWPRLFVGENGVNCVLDYKEVITKPAKPEYGDKVEHLIDEAGTVVRIRSMPAGRGIPSELLELFSLHSYTCLSSDSELVTKAKF